MLRIEAIVAKRQPIATGNLIALLQQEVGALGFAGEMVRRMSDYPPARPWRSRPPTKGPRKGGRRTGAYGRGWRIGAERDLTQTGGGGFRITGSARNRVHYAVFVGGPRPGAYRRRQTDVMRSRGWPSITFEARRGWAKYRPRVVRILTQRDRRLQARRLGATG